MAASAIRNRNTTGTGVPLIELGDGSGRVDIFLAGGRKLAVVVPPGPHRLADEYTVLDCEGRAVEKNTAMEALAQARRWAEAWAWRNPAVWTVAAR